MHSYVTAYANSLHNSRVDFPSFAPRSLSPATGGAVLNRPQFVLTSPEASHVVVVGSGRPAHVPGRPSDRSSRHDELGPGAYMLGTSGYFDGAVWQPWDGRAEKLAFREEERVLAVWTDGNRSVEVQSINGGEERQTVGLVARFSADRMFKSIKIRGYVIDAFVAADGGVFVLQSTAIRGYASEFSGKVSGFADSWEVTEAATTISMPDERAYAISGVDGGIAVLRGNRIVSMNQSGTWRTRVELLTIEGKERWRADVDWPVRQPVIDGGGGRVYVAGDRLAALDHGDTVWEVLGGRVRATAFSDGAVAFTQGSTLQIRTRDGQEVAKLETPDRAELVTPPAIASDGSIWVASESEIYVARWPR